MHNKTAESGDFSSNLVNNYVPIKNVDIFSLITWTENDWIAFYESNELQRILYSYSIEV